MASDHSRRRFWRTSCRQGAEVGLVRCDLDRSSQLPSLSGTSWPGCDRFTIARTPLRSVLAKQKNTRVLLGSVEDLDPKSKEVFLADGAVLAYDSLIVATGSQTSYFGNNEWQEWA